MYVYKPIQKQHVVHMFYKVVTYKYTTYIKSIYICICRYIDIYMYRYTWICVQYFYCFVQYYFHFELFLYFSCYCCCYCYYRCFCCRYYCCCNFINSPKSSAIFCCYCCYYTDSRSKVHTYSTY